MSAPAPHADVSAMGRRVAAAIAAIGWLALALQLTVSITMLTSDGHSLAGAVWRYLGYFTILTNLIVAVTMTRVAQGRWPGGTLPDVPAITGVVLTIAIVCVTYDLLLSGRVPAMGPLWWTADRLLHYVVPVLSVGWWLVWVPKQALGAAHPPRWLIFPALYLVYAIVRGAVDGWYPYYFIDAGALGYAQTLTNALVLSAAMLVAGYVVVGVVALTRGRRDS